MFASFSEFKFFQSFRIPVEAADDVRCIIEVEDESGKLQRFDEAKLEDVSITGIGFTSRERFSVGRSVRFSIQFKRILIDIEGSIVRSFGYELEDEHMLYGVETDEEDHANMKRFIELYVKSFSPDRARDSLSKLALSERYKSATEGFEVFSLMLSLFKDITSFGTQDNFLKNMLEEITRILNAQRASIFLINPKTNELEAVCALGADEEKLKFDYRKGIAGSVFTTGVPLNIDTEKDEVRFSEKMDVITGFETRSILCFPISNREDKVIGVIEVLNKRNEDRFTVEDEKTMKVLALIFSSVFHCYNPISEKSLIRRFSTPYDREYAFIGRSNHTSELRKSIVQIKDLDTPLLIEGDQGVGKKLLAQIVHNEGKRGLNNFKVVHCSGLDEKGLEELIWGDDSVLELCIGGSILFHEIDRMSLSLQRKLYNTLQDRRLTLSSEITFDVRAIFSTSQTVGMRGQDIGIYPELFDYINSSLFKIEPLRKRPQDIEDLISYFLRKECKKQGLLLKEFSEDIMEMLKSYDWPGNVYELQKAIEKAVLYNPRTHIITKLKNGATPIIDISKSSVNGLDTIPHARDYNISLKDRVLLVEREMIIAEIRRHKGNKSKASKAMGISREALRKKMLASDEIIARLNQSGTDQAA